MPTKRLSLTLLTLALALPVLMANNAAAQPAAMPDWKNDAPGYKHRIDVAGLPAPQQSNTSPPAIVAKPDDAKLKLPPGFKIDVFTRDVKGPRAMRVAPNGDIFVAEMKTGMIKILRQSADGASVASSVTYVEGLNQPFGLRFYPAGNNPQWLYVGENNRV
ncbi:MAG TPA: sorbosone dehydrogenase family protein, partial [Gammaproteobacteria bacterium]|nr:sorbosone dehydrogenase family protein [Gammaproteobacteria bacterium]